MTTLNDDATLFRAGMRRVAGAVTVVSTLAEDGGRRGVTATAVCSLTVDPPAVIACINRETSVGRAAPLAGVFSVSVLTRAQQDIAETFAGRTGHVGADRFAAGRWSAGTTGAPLLDGALASFDCRLEKAVAFATHVVLFGAVVGTRLGPADAEALLYADGRFTGLAPAEIGLALAGNG